MNEFSFWRTSILQYYFGNFLHFLEIGQMLLLALLIQLSNLWFFRFLFPLRLLVFVCSHRSRAWLRVHDNSSRLFCPSSNFSDRIFINLWVGMGIIWEVENGRKKLVSFLKLRVSKDKGNDKVLNRNVFPKQKAELCPSLILMSLCSCWQVGIKGWRSLCREDHK